MGLGDALMAAGAAERLSRATGKRVCIVDQYGRPQWNAMWDGNPFIAVRGPDTVDYRDHAGHRPYIERFDERRFVWREYRPHPATIVLTDEERAFGRQFVGRIVVELDLKPTASPNKQWPAAHWAAFADMARSLHLVHPVKSRLRLPMVEQIDVGTPRLLAAAIAHCRAYVGHEGAMHHLAAAFGRPAVVIMGGFIGPQHTGYDIPTHRYLTGHPIACGSRQPCGHCADAMRSITPEAVYSSLQEVLEWE